MKENTKNRLVTRKVDIMLVEENWIEGQECIDLEVENEDMENHQIVGDHDLVHVHVV